MMATVILTINRQSNDNIETTITMILTLLMRKKRTMKKRKGQTLLMHKTTVKKRKGQTTTKRRKRQKIATERTAEERLMKIKAKGAVFSLIPLPLNLTLRNQTMRKQMEKRVSLH